MLFHKSYKNKIVHFKNNFYSIGDMICSFPILVALIKETKKVYVEISSYDKTMQSKMEELFELFPKKYKFEKYDENISYDEKVIIPGPAATYSYEYYTNKIHMTQIHFKHAKMKIPKNPIQPELQVPYMKTDSYDYLIAPYAYSLTPIEFLPFSEWQKLIDAFPDRKFGIFGQKKLDENRLNGDNVTHIFDKSYVEVANIMKRSGPLISVVTGIGHLAYALGTPHIQLTNQLFWSINPNAIARIESRTISLFPAKSLINIIKRIENGETGIIIPKDYNYANEQIQE